MPNQRQPRYKPGDKIGGRYQVHKALMGGMGEVYLCLDLFGDPLLASAGLDRLLHHAEILVASGSSYRARHRERLGEEVFTASESAS